MSEVKLISDPEVVDLIVGFIEEDSPKAMMNVIRGYKLDINSNILIDKKETSLIYYCCEQEKIQCSLKLFKKNVVNGLDQTILYLIDKCNGSPTNSRSVYLRTGFELCQIYVKGIYEKVEQKIKSLSDFRGLFDFLMKMEVNLGRFIQNSDITILLDIFFETDNRASWNIASRELLGIILCKKQSLKEYDSVHYLLHQVITNDLPLVSSRVLQLLLMNECDPNQGGKYAVLMDLVICLYKDPRLYEILIQAGCNVNCVNIANETALIKLFKLWKKCNERTNVAKMLIKNKARVDVVDENGHDYKYYAELTNDKEFINEIEVNAE